MDVDSEYLKSLTAKCRMLQWSHVLMDVDRYPKVSKCDNCSKGFNGATS